MSELNRGYEAALGSILFNSDEFTNPQKEDNGKAYNKMMKLIQKALPFIKPDAENIKLPEIIEKFLLEE